MSMDALRYRSCETNLYVVFIPKMSVEIDLQGICTKRELRALSVEEQTAKAVYTLQEAVRFNPQNDPLVREAEPDLSGVQKITLKPETVQNLTRLMAMPDSTDKKVGILGLILANSLENQSL